MNRFGWIGLAVMGGLCAGGCREGTKVPPAAAMTQTLKKMIEYGRAGIMLENYESACAGASVTPQEEQALREYVPAHPDASSFVFLQYLRKHDRGAYDRVPVETRAAILCGGLRNMTTGNGWAYLHEDGSKDSEAGMALRETGGSALVYLAALLDDKSHVGFSGSAARTVAIAQEWRRCDFAYRFAMLAKRRLAVFVFDMRRREELVSLLKKELAAGAAGTGRDAAADLKEIQDRLEQYRLYWRHGDPSYSEPPTSEAKGSGPQLRSILTSDAAVSTDAAILARAMYEAMGRGDVLTSADHELSDWLREFPGHPVPGSRQAVAGICRKLEARDRSTLSAEMRKRTCGRLVDSMVFLTGGAARDPRKNGEIDWALWPALRMALLAWEPPH